MTVNDVFIIGLGLYTGCAIVWFTKNIVFVELELLVLKLRILVRNLTH